MVERAKVCLKFNTIQPRSEKIHAPDRSHTTRRILFATETRAPTSLSYSYSLQPVLSLHLPDDLWLTCNSPLILGDRWGRHPTFTFSSSLVKNSIVLQNSPRHRSERVIEQLDLRFASLFHRESRKKRERERERERSYRRRSIDKLQSSIWEEGRRCVVPDRPRICHRRRGNNFADVYPRHATMDSYQADDQW